MPDVVENKRERSSSSCCGRSPQLPVFLLVAIAIGISLWQGHEMVNVIWNFSEEELQEEIAAMILPKRVNVSATINSTQQIMTPNSSDDDDKNKKNIASPSHEIDASFDLIFWSKLPLLNIERGNVVVTRNKVKSIMEEVIRVDFRHCNDSCPMVLPGNWNTDKLKALRGWEQNNERKLQIHFRTERRPKQMMDLRHLEVVTFWSGELEQHIPTDYAKGSIQLVGCGSKQRPCPEPCPQNTPGMDYPYLRDRHDGICKSSHPRANPPLRPFGGPCGCEGTCFTPESGDLNSPWPFRNVSEREFFLPHWNKPNKVRHLHNQALRHAALRRSSEQWSTYKARFACPKGDNSTETTPPGIVGAYLHHLYYIPEAKLIFCGIPKVGVTEWNKFFRYVMGAKDYLSLPHYKEDRKYFHIRNLDNEKAEELWRDPSWTKAVFFRNPLERLLSAYIDKVVGMSYTQKVFHIGNLTTPKKERPVLTFAEFVDKITDTFPAASNCQNPNGLSACTDPHWAPQTMTCGLDYLLPKFDYLGNFDHISEHTKFLLERVGLWETYGKTFDDGKNNANAGNNMCKVPPPKRDRNVTIWGFNQRGPSVSAKTVHATGSQSRFDELYTTDLIAKVRKAYSLDFAVWDEISKKNATDVARGMDLKVVRDYCNL